MLNKVQIIGNLGGDPELRHTQSGQQVTNFSVATTNAWTDKNGDKQESTEWHRIVVWGKQAETCEKYLQKGSKVYVEGRIQTRQYEDGDGNTKYTSEIVANSVLFLTPKGESTSAPASNDAGSGDDLPF